MKNYTLLIPLFLLLSACGTPMPDGDLLRVTPQNGSGSSGAGLGGDSRPLVAKATPTSLQALTVDLAAQSIEAMQIAAEAGEAMSRNNNEAAQAALQTATKKAAEAESNRLAEQQRTMQKVLENERLRIEQESKRVELEMLKKQAALELARVQQVFELAFMLVVVAGIPVLLSWSRMRTAQYAAAVAAIPVEHDENVMDTPPVIHQHNEQRPSAYPAASQKDSAFGDEQWGVFWQGVADGKAVSYGAFTPSKNGFSQDEFKKFCDELEEQGIAKYIDRQYHARGMTLTDMGEAERDKRRNVSPTPDGFVPVS